MTGPNGSAAAPLDVSRAVKDAFESASPEARTLVVKVLEIEQRNKHLSRPHVAKEIQKAIKAAVAGGA